MDSLNPHVAFESRRGLAILLRQLRERDNHFHMSTSDFISHFRLNQELAIALIEELAEISVGDEDTRAIPFHLKCLVALNFYGTGSYQKSVKNISHLSQPSVSRGIKEVSELLNKIAPKYISFPMTQDERAEIQRAFEEQGLPGVIGLIDCTQIAVSGLKKEVEFAYVCRKGYHTINTQIICDHRMLIRNINARYCGSTHDSFIWGNSIILAHFENTYVSADEQQCWLLGDSGYPLQPWLITPITNAQNQAEEYFNFNHKKILSHVERVNGVWKNRFRCIIGERKLHNDPTAAAKIINATAVLHNFLILNKYSDEFSTSSTIPPVPPVINATEHPAFRGRDTYLNAGKEVRRRIVQSLHQQTTTATAAIDLHNERT